MWYGNSKWTDTSTYGLLFSALFVLEGIAFWHFCENRYFQIKGNIVDTWATDQKTPAWNTMSGNIQDLR